jgi:hypothetical protein
MINVDKFNISIPSEGGQGARSATAALCLERQQTSCSSHRKFETLQMRRAHLVPESPTRILMRREVELIDSAPPPIAPALSKSFFCPFAQGRTYFAGISRAA